MWRAIDATQKNARKWFRVYVESEGKSYCWAKCGNELPNSVVVRGARDGSYEKTTHPREKPK
jgi:hypothetical protein